MKFKSKVDLIYEQIVESILKGTYKQGDRIVISNIAKSNKVSDIPVREALRRLESEGLVQMIANHGAVVTKYEPCDILQLHMIISIMGSYATRLSADHLTEKDYEELIKVNEEIKIAALSKDTSRFSELNQQFHLAMANAIPFEMIRNLVKDTWMKWTRFENNLFFPEDKQIQSYDEHLRILELAKEKRYEELERYVRLHTLDSTPSFIL